MKASSRRIRYGISFLVTLAGMCLWLAMPNLQAGRASASEPVKSAAQKPVTAGLDPERRAALEKLLAQSKAGATFSEEETSLLRRYAAGEMLSQLEADTLISRALYHYHVMGNELTREQQDLLGRYSVYVARRNTDVLDLKIQAMNQRIAAAANAPRSNAPLAPPANDACATAIVIPAAGPFPVNTTPVDVTMATLGGDPPTPSCFTTGTPGRSIWYTFTPSATATYTLTTCQGDGAASNLDDPIMAIYTSTGGCAGPFTEIPFSGPSVGCNDDGCLSLAFQPVITTQLNSGTQYFIVIWDLTSTAPPAGANTVQLIVRQTTVPGNDTCASPSALTLSTPVNGTTQGATNDYQLSGSACFTGVGQTQSDAVGRDVVYSFTAPVAGTYSFKVTNYFNSISPPFVTSNLVLYVASTCPAATPGVPVVVGSCLGAANRASASTSEEVMCLSLSAGQQVFVFVDEASITTDGSTFTLEASRCVRETEPNDTPATANTTTFAMEGSIGVAGDVDFFALGTPAAGSRVFALIDGVASRSTDFDLRVTTATDTLEFDDPNADVPFGTRSGTVGGTPANGAPLFLRVNLGPAAGVTTDEPYRIYFALQPPGANPVAACPSVTTSATDESEPNNTTATANSAANNFFEGSLAGPAPSSDTDVFSFTSMAGDLVFLSLDGDPCRNNTPINAVLALLDSAGTQLISVNDTGSTSCSPGDGCDTGPAHPSLTALTPNTTAESLVFRITTSGTYYARVTADPSSSGSSGAGDYLLSITKAGPTAVRFSNEDANTMVKAISYEDGASVRWQTGYEVENLGFNVYRDDAGHRTRVNPQLIAGSALLVGTTTALSAGRSYAWFDAAATATSQYWIEAVDLNGESSWQGPIAVGRAPGKVADPAQSTTLGELGRFNIADAQTARVERNASVKSVSAAGITLQTNPAGQSSAKLAVSGEGFYRISLSELAAAGFNAGNDLRNLQLYVDGEQIPINLNAGSGGSTAIEFYGVGVESAVTVERVYWLVNGSQPGLRMPQIAAPSLPITGGSFLYSAELKPRSIYFSGLRNGDKENFFGPVITSTPVDQSLALQHVDLANTGGAQLEVALQGVTMTGHRVEVQLNGTRAGEVVFNNQSAGVALLQIAQSLLKEGANTVRLVSLGGASDISLLDYVRMTYRHTLVADNNQLRFTASSKQTVSVDGFSSANIRVFDVTSPNAPQEIAGTVKASKTGYSVSLSVPGPGLRTLVTMTDDSVRRPAGVKLNRPSNWRQPAQAADYVIITPGEMMTAFDSLTKLRQLQGYKVAVVDIEDVYDEFSYGNKTPQAIKDFLAYAAGNWKTAPRYVLIGGDASYDAKNYLGLGNYDLVPTKLVDTELMETASDDWYADFKGSGLAEIAIGRLPVRTASEASAMAAKIAGYDQTARPEGVLLVADDGSDGTSFETASDELRTLIPTSQRVEQINRGELDPMVAKGRLLDALNRGPRVVNYYGHANVNQWRGNLLTGGDAAQLANGGDLSLFVMMTCLNGYFHDPALDSLAESLLKAKGGAVAVWASSGMTEPGDQSLMDIEMFRRLFDAGSGLTVGEASLRAKVAVRSRDARLIWILLGDPATRLR